MWNRTRQCNLYCEHCYAGADLDAAPGELTTAEGTRMLDGLADYGVPVVSFSGGEPMVHDDLETLVAHAADAGIRPVLSADGALATEGDVFAPDPQCYCGARSDAAPRPTGVRRRPTERVTRHTLAGAAAAFYHRAVWWPVCP